MFKVKRFNDYNNIIIIIIIIGNNTFDSSSMNSSSKSNSRCSRKNNRKKKTYTNENTDSLFVSLRQYYWLSSVLECVQSTVYIYNTLGCH